MSPLFELPIPATFWDWLALVSLLVLTVPLWATITVMVCAFGYWSLKRITADEE